VQHHSQDQLPALLVHGIDDATVPVAEAKSIYANRTGDRVRLLILAGDHDSIHELDRHVDKQTTFLDQAMACGVTS